jgi:hypothetical protein
MKLRRNKIDLFRWIEHYRTKIQQAKKCLLKKSVDGSDFEDFKYDEIRNQNANMPERGEPRTWEYTERRLKDFIKSNERQILSCKKDDKKINEKINEKIKNL